MLELKEQKSEAFAGLKGLGFTQEQLEAARSEGFEAGKKSAMENVSSHLKYIDKVQDNSKVIENIKNDVPYVECVESYAESKAAKQISKELSSLFW